MDLIQIGQYIAGKRKEQGMTQRQLAEKLGMSDKSVSKWERGICLPDVSVYEDLCGLLGITVNEFLAGEDIEESNIARRAEENLMDVSRDSRNKQRKLKWIIRILAGVLILAVSSTLYWLKRPQNFVTRLYESSVELNTAMMILGYDKAGIYKFTTTDHYQSLTLHLYEYRFGELVEHQSIQENYEFTGSPGSGTLSVAPDFENHTVKIYISDDSGSTVWDEFPLLTGISDQQNYLTFSSRVDSDIPICYNTEQEMMVLGFIDGTREQIPETESVTEIITEDDPSDTRLESQWMDYDVVYCFCFEFTR